MSESVRKSSPKEHLSHAKSLIQNAVKDEQILMGASCIAVCAGEVFFQEAGGRKFSSLPVNSADSAKDLNVDTDTVFDVGSLTGSVVTACLAMRLVAEGRLRLEDRVSRYLQNFGVLGKAEITVAHLLTHTSGLPQHYSFQKDLPDLSRDALLGAKTSRGSKDALSNALNRMSLRAEPGLKHVWSEVGLIVLGLVIENVTGLAFDELADKYLFRPLRLRSTSFISLEKLSKQKLATDNSRIAASGRCSSKGIEVHGEPFDFVARALGGVAGHAGLFSSALDLGIFGLEMMRSLSTTTGLIPAQLAEYFIYSENENRISYNYGWEDLASQPELSRAQFSKKAFGRASCLGSALWLDPELELVIALTANRKNPMETSRKMEQFRADLAGSLVQTIRAL